MAARYGYGALRGLVLLGLMTQGAHAVWPLPAEVEGGKGVATLSPTFRLKLTGDSAEGPLMKKATDRYSHLIDQRTVSQGRSLVVRRLLTSTLTLDVLEVKVAQAEAEAELQLMADESYSLVVQPNSACLTAATVWGALRGLETFYQLLSAQSDGTLVVNVTSIRDKPRFSHRGLLVDTARHFIPLLDLLKVIDAMSYSKLNVLHWHLVDDESFPYVSEALPQLAAKGAYSPSHTYSPAAVQELIAYARDRGVRVMPEFDTPGHTQSWGKGYPELLTQCYDRSGKPSGKGPVDPTKETSYELIDKLWTELASVFPDKFLHLGGDEVDLNCWLSNPDVQDFVWRHNMTSVRDLERHYCSHIVKSANAQNRTAVVWQEIFDNGAASGPDHTVVHVWMDEWQRRLSAVTEAGYGALLSSPWYLNYASYPYDWKPYYRVEPTNFTGSAAQKALVIGGEACMWGEHVDGSNIIQRLWPRVGAVAERLWSPQATGTDEADAEQRLMDFRCQLVARGIAAEPVEKGTFCEPELDQEPQLGPSVL